MIYELPKPQYDKIKGIFKDWKYNVRVISVIEGNTKGKIWVDNVEHPSTALVWSHFDMFTLGGCATKEFTNALEHYVTAHIKPEADAIGLNFFAVQLYPRETWEKEIRTLFKHPLKMNIEYQFTFNHDKYLKYLEITIPSGFSLVQIDEQLLECNEHLRNEIEETWISIDKFMEKGIGYCLLNEDEVICGCISRHVGGKEHNIKITTYKENNRRKGFATVTAKAFIDQCLLTGVAPVWKADEHNTASLRVAEKLGFEKREGYPDYYFIFSETGT